MSTQPVIDMCLSARVIVTCGTGGVGKTSVAAALGFEVAQQGKRAIVITIDPARRLADAIGLGEGTGNEIQRVPLDTTGELWVTMLDVQETFDSLVRDTSPTPERAKEVMDTPFTAVCLDHCLAHVTTWLQNGCTTYAKILDLMSSSLILPPHEMLLIFSSHPSVLRDS